MLGLPELYARLPHLLELQPFESQQTVEKARELEALTLEYIAESRDALKPLGNLPKRG